MMIFTVCLFLLIITIQSTYGQFGFNFGGGASAPTYMLYTRNNRNNPQRLRNANADDIRNSQFDGSRGTKMMVFGYLDNPSFGQWMQKMKNRFLDYDDYNVMIVDWSRSNLNLYPQAVANARAIGPMVAAHIRALCNIRNSNPSRFHILGHSLGAHLAGYAGKAMNGQLGQITGLDPAGPSFENASPSRRLWNTDAQFVDVIHTDAGNLGMWQTCGNVDIYPNGGANQPGCQNRLNSFTQAIAAGARNFFACDHVRAPDLYIDAIGQRTFLAYQCDNYDNFRAGRCNSCGQNGSQCVAIGPRAAQYRFNGPRGGAGGKRFFMNTAASEPYLR